MEVRKGKVVAIAKNRSAIQVQFPDELQWIYPTRDVESRNSFFTNIKVGATYAFKGERSRKGYFYVVSYELLSPAPPGSHSNNNYLEQKDNRITRLSVLNAALKFFEINGGECTVEDVLKVAEQFENWANKVMD